MPSDSFKSKSKVIGVTRNKNYARNSFMKLLKDVESSIGRQMYRKTTGDRRRNRKHSGVNLYCIYSLGIQTPKLLNYTFFKDKCCVVE